MTSVAVLGAGITGVTTAYKLALRGFEVTVFDRQPYAAMETSFANGGQLSASNAEVWNSPATFLKGLKWMLRKDAPLLVHPTPTWHKLSWMLEFVAAARHYRENTIRTAQLAIAAREHLLGMAEAEGFDFDCEKRGILHVYESKSEFEHAQEVSRLYAEAGLERRELAADEIAAVEPNVHGRFHGGFFTPSDFTGDIHKYTRGLAEAAKRRGVQFVHDARVERVRHGEDGVSVEWLDATDDSAAADVRRFDSVVVCAGVGSRKLAAQLGDRVNVYPVKGYSVTVNLQDEESQASAPWVSLLDDKAKIVTSRLGLGRLRIAGTAEFAGENRDIRQSRIEPLTAWCRTRFPGVSTASIVPWAGLRPMMPDMLPRVGRGRAPGVFYNTGHGHLGWTLSAITAEMISAEVAEAFAGRIRRPVAGSAAEAPAGAAAQTA
ncbi:D-amino acid dehydrogenase [Mangrovibrevibacter kandeliae]|uniref:D-amino acid dehydrogenase n=1 Tax=Mangrovibrevibacter kandeliae TaxID=2968473 RepID=UPI00211860C1|nr:D-amino acid dehydrogenase [Aurantimonas sp. MSK8Z-1]MCQ8782017.1 D-amino acid dehydrogenase [Aurantimonas sp. CSK15Z-1]MCW4115323.1 D-amino acid dehydrogenase [Aurantimonas sp. MSK8Z-1]